MLILSVDKNVTKLKNIKKISNIKNHILVKKNTNLHIQIKIQIYMFLDR